MSDYKLGTAWLQVSLSGQGVAKQVKRQLGDTDTGPLGQKITSTVGNAFKSAAVIGATALATAGAVLASYSGEALKASDSAQKFASTLEFAGIGTDKIKELTASTKQYAAQTVYDIGDIRQTTAALAANGVADYDKLAQAAGNLNAVAGGSAETYKTVGSVMAQTAGAGKLVTENWNQIRDAVPGASKRIKDALAESGAYVGDFNDAMMKGEITAEEFNDAIMKLGFEDAAVKAAASTATFEGAWGNFEATITDGLSDLIDVFKSDLTGGLTVASDALQAFFGHAKTIAEGLRAIFKEGDYIGFGDLEPGEDHPIIHLLFDIREQAELFKAAMMPIGGLALGALGPLVSGLPVVGGLFTGLTGPVGLVIGLFAQMYSNSQLFRDGIGAVGEAVASIFFSLTPVIEPVLQLVSTFATMLGNTLGLALQAIAPVIAQVVTALAGTLAPAIERLQPVLSGVMTVFNMFVQAITSVITAVLPTLMPVIEQLGLTFQLISTPLQGLVNTLINALRPAIDALIPIFIEAGTQIAGIIQEVLPIANMVIVVIGQIIEALSPLITTLVSNLIPVIQSLLPVVQTVFETARGVIEGVMNVISGIIKTVTGIIKGDWSMAWEGIKQIFQGIWDAIKSLLSGALELVKNLITANLEAIKAIWKSIWDTVLTLFGGVWDGIKSAASAGVDAVYNTVVGIKDKIVGFFSGAGQWLWDAGSAIIDGLIDGIYSGFEWVKSTLNDLTALLPEWKGPAELDRVILRESGRLVIGGFKAGLEDEYRSVEKSLGNFTRGLTAAPHVNVNYANSNDSARGGIVVNQNIAVANVPDSSDMASMAAEQARLLGGIL